jgi:tetratricopeptide (TPR) repeat protein
VDEAIAHFQQALLLDPKYAKAYTNLGIALYAKGQVDQAITHWEQAIHLDPKVAPAHNNLGIALSTKGHVDEAIAQLQQALLLDPKDALAHTNLGTALSEKGHMDEAIAHFQQALQLHPKDAWAHNNLGAALQATGRVDEAIAHFQQALQLDPKYAKAYTNLGTALSEKGRVDEAIAHLRQALQLDLKDAKAHGVLGQSLLGQGRFQEARDATRRGLALLPPGSPLRPIVSQQLKQCEHFLVLEGRLPAVLQGDDKPTPSERLLFAEMCVYTKRYAAAVRLFAAALAEQPQLGDDRQAPPRYNAACAAALASTGQGNDAAKLSDQDKTKLRQQSLDWLRAELTAWSKVRDRALVRGMLQHWQKDSDFAGLRDQAALAKLPPAEAEAWQKLWADVADLLHQSDDKGKGQSGKADPDKMKTIPRG